MISEANNVKKRCTAHTGTLTQTGCLFRVSLRACDRKEGVLRDILNLNFRVLGLAKWSLLYLYTLEMYGGGMYTELCISL